MIPASRRPQTEPQGTVAPDVGASAITPPDAAADLDRAAGGTAEAAEGAAGYGALLRSRQFLLIWAAQLLSQSAQNVVNYALVVEVERLTQSSANVGGVVVAFSLPVLLLGPSAGVFVDRVGKRGVLLWTNLLRGLLMVAYLYSPRSLLTIYGVTLLASVISQFFGPAEGAILPLLVKRRALIAATSLFNLTFTGAQIAGFILIGPTLYKVLGPASLFVAVVVMYALAALSVALLPREETANGSLRDAVSRALQLRLVWGDMREARLFLQKTPGITQAMAHLALASALLITLATLGPGFVARVLGLGPEDAGYILAPAGLGMIVTTGLIGQYAVKADRVKLACYGLLAMGTSLAALALVRPVFEYFQTELARGGPGAIPAVETLGYLGLVCLVTFSLGVEFSFVTIPAQTMISEATAPHLRGRVFALLFMITGSVSTVPAIVIGALADSVGIIPMLLSLAGTVGLAGVWGLVGRTRSPGGRDQRRRSAASRPSPPRRTRPSVSGTSAAGDDETGDR